MLFIVITCQIDRSDSRQILFEIEYNYFIISNIKKINIEKKKNYIRGSFHEFTLATIFPRIFASEILLN